nr:immunoglobulin heavy chain junction region [Mus musculus]
CAREYYYDYDERSFAYW